MITYDLPRITPSTNRRSRRRFYGGAAVPLSVPATPGTPGYIADFKFPYDPKLAGELLAKSGFSPSKPAQIKFATTNGQFPSDFDMARAIQQMWKKVGIDAEIETIEYAKYFELNRGAKLPEATLYSWDNATGDPEMFSGYLFNPKMPFSAWKGDVGRFRDHGVVQHRGHQQTHRRLSCDRPERDRKGRCHPAVAKREDRRAQEEPELRQIRERLGSRQQHGLDLILLLLVRRALVSVVILFFVSALLFCILRMLPVDPAAMSLPPMTRRSPRSRLSGTKWGSISRCP